MSKRDIYISAGIVFLAILLLGAIGQGVYQSLYIGGGDFTVDKDGHVTAVSYTGTLNNEADPVFGASEAATLVAGDKLKLDSALQIELDPVFEASEAHSFAAGDKLKLNGIAAGAEVNVNPDWNAVAGDAQILNKPTLGSMAAQAASSVAITGGSIANITDLAVADGGTGASTAAGAASALGVGTEDSPSFTGLTLTNDLAVAHGGTGASNATDARTNLSAQQADAELTAIAGLVSAANRIPYFTGSGSAGLLTLGSFGDDLLAYANAAAVASGIGMGTEDSPAFTGLTLTNNLAIADGGTSADTAEGAASALGVGTEDSPQFMGLRVGVNDTSAGQVEIFGNSSDAPGHILLHSPANSDDVVNYWTLWAPAGDFSLYSGLGTSVYDVDDATLAIYPRKPIIYTPATLGAQGDTTPSVAGGTVFNTGSYTSVNSITALDDGDEGQIVIITCTDTDFGLVDGSRLVLAGSVNWDPDSVGDTIMLVCHMVIANSSYFTEISRSNN